jgi:uncharacterized protein YjbJ (UPF0337 family)
MGERIDIIKGKAKQVQGVITGDKQRQIEGQLDEAKGTAKGIVNRAEEAVQSAVAAVATAVKKVRQ